MVRKTRLRNFAVVNGQKQSLTGIGNKDTVALLGR